MEENQSPKAPERENVSIPVEVFKIVERILENDNQMVKQIETNIMFGEAVRNSELKKSFIQNAITVRELLLPFFTKASNNKRARSSTDNENSERSPMKGKNTLRDVREKVFKNFGKSSFREVEMKSCVKVFVEWDNFLRENDLWVFHKSEEECNFEKANNEKNSREENIKEFIREILEKEKRKAIRNYEDDDKQTIIGLEIFEKRHNLKPMTKEEKIEFVENSRRHEREHQKPVVMEIEEVPFSALGELGLIGDLMRDIDLIFNRMTEIIGDSTRQIEKEVLIKLTRSHLRKIKQELDKI